MAAIKGNRVDNGDGTVTITWGSMATTDTGDVVNASDLEALTVHVVSAGAGTAQVQGSNDGTNFVSIGAAQAQGTLVQLAVNPRFLKLSAIAGATSLVYLHGRKPRA